MDWIPRLRFRQSGIFINISAFFGERMRKGEKDGSGSGAYRHNTLRKAAKSKEILKVVGILNRSFAVVWRSRVAAENIGGDIVFVRVVAIAASAQREMPLSFVFFIAFRKIKGHKKLLSNIFDYIFSQYRFLILYY